MSLESLMRQTFDAVNQHSVDGIVKNWSPTGTYDNPGVGPPATGTEALRAAMTTLIGNVKKAGVKMIVDRVTVQEPMVITEWHAEPRNGKRGVHVAEFGPDQKLVKVTVYPRDT